MGCLRPATPSNVPIIGKIKYDNLYVNTGHGTLGMDISLWILFVYLKFLEKDLLL